MNAHDRTIELAAIAIDFVMTAAERAKLDAHLQECPSCRRTASAFRSDARAIAAFPDPQLRPGRADAILAGAVRRPGGRPVLRFVAIAALLALLGTSLVVVGAEIVRRLETPPPLVILEGPTPSPVSSTGPDLASCPATTSIADLFSLGPAQASSCYGSRELVALGAIPHASLGFDSCPGREPAWLSCNDGSYLTSGPGDSSQAIPFAHDGDLPIIRPPTGGASAPGSPINGFWANFTAHYADRAAGDCRATDPDDEFYEDPAGLRDQCEETLVVTAVEVLPADQVPRVDLGPAAWKQVSGPEAFGSPALTSLKSVVTMGGRWFVVSDTQDGPDRFDLWTSLDLRAWEEVDTGDFSPTGLATDGVRLIAIGEPASTDIRVSSDGRTWEPTSGMGPDADPAVVGGTPKVVFAAGSDGIDAAIWRLEGTRWAQAALDNNAGWLGGQDASPAVVTAIVSTSRSYVAIGSVPPDTGAGFQQTSVWTSPDGLTWRSEPSIPSVAATMPGAAFGSWTDTDVVVGSYVAIDPTGPAAWIKRGAAWEQGSFQGAPQPGGNLRHLVPFGHTMLAVGYDDRTFEGQPLRTVLWGSSDGSSWWQLTTGDLGGGLPAEVIETRSGTIVAVGRQFLGGTAAWDSPHGPAVYELTSEAP